MQSSWPRSESSAATRSDRRIEARRAAPSPPSPASASLYRVEASPSRKHDVDERLMNTPLDPPDDRASWMTPTKTDRTVTGEFQVAVQSSARNILVARRPRRGAENAEAHVFVGTQQCRRSAHRCRAHG